MVNQKTGIKEADMKALFHAICVGASSMQDTNTALAFKFIQLGAEVRAAMASGIVTNHEEMCTIFDCAYMETRGRSTTTTAPPTGRPQVVYLAQEYERPQAQPHYHAQGGRGSGARGGGTNGGGAAGRVEEDTTQAGAAEDETIDTSRRTCDISHTWQREKKAAR